MIKGSVVGYSSYFLDALNIKIVAKDVSVFLNNFIASYEYCLPDTRLFSLLTFRCIPKMRERSNIENRW
jgi:hypothetical protein